MKVSSAIEKRRSVRSYKSKPVSDQDLNDLLDAARMAPSASNKQDWKFIAVKEEHIRSQLAKAAKDQVFVAEAPVVLAGVSLEPQRVLSCDVPAYAVDLAIALDHITLLAVEKGLGTCWIGAFDQDKVKEILEIPPDLKVVSLLTLGYPDDSPGRKRRKNLEEVISYDKFS